MAEESETPDSDGRKAVAEEERKRVLATGASGDVENPAAGTPGYVEYEDFKPVTDVNQAPQPVVEDPEPSQDPNVRPVQPHEVDQAARQAARKR